MSQRTLAPIPTSTAFHLTILLTFPGKSFQPSDPLLILATCIPPGSGLDDVETLLSFPFLTLCEKIYLCRPGKITTAPAYLIFLAFFVILRTVLVILGDNSGPTSALLLCAFVDALVYGLYQILSVGRRGRGLPPGRLYLWYDFVY